MGGADASDLFVTEGHKPAWRIFGELKPLDGAEPDRTAFTRFFEDYLPPDTMTRLEAQRDLDLGVSLGEGERYRLNLFFQKGRLSMVARRVPLGNLEFESSFLILPARINFLLKLLRNAFLRPFILN